VFYIQAKTAQFMVKMELFGNGYLEMEWKGMDWISG